MKTWQKTIVIAIMSFFIALYGMMWLGNVVYVLLPGGDGLLEDYFNLLYGSITVLVSVVITCTYIVIKKINTLIETNKHYRDSK